MTIIKKKILLEDFIDRNYNSRTYGSVTADTFFLTFHLTQDIDDMGSFTDVPFVPKQNQSTVDYTILKEKLNSENIMFPFMSGASVIINYNNKMVDIRTTGKTKENYFQYGRETVTGLTTNMVNDVRSYNNINPFEVGLDVNSYEYINFSGKTQLGVDRVFSSAPNIKYMIGVDPVLFNQFNNNTIISGLVYEVIDDDLSIFKFLGQGSNITNIDLSALTKEDYLFGIISKPEIENDVFIDRGISSPLERHSKIADINSLDNIERYNGGYFQIIRE